MIKLLYFSLFEENTVSCFKYTAEVQGNTQIKQIKLKLQPDLLRDSVCPTQDGVEAYAILQFTDSTLNSESVRISAIDLQNDVVFTFDYSNRGENYTEILKYKVINYDVVFRGSIHSAGSSNQVFHALGDNRECFSNVTLIYDTSEASQSFNVTFTPLSCVINSSATVFLQLEYQKNMWAEIEIPNNPSMDGNALFFGIKSTYQHSDQKFFNISRSVLQDPLKIQNFKQFIDNFSKIPNVKTRIRIQFVSKFMQAVVTADVEETVSVVSYLHQADLYAVVNKNAIIVLLDVQKVIKQPFPAQPDSLLISLVLLDNESVIMETNESWAFNQISFMKSFIVPCPNTDWMTDAKFYSQQVQCVVKFSFRDSEGNNIQEWYTRRPSRRPCYKSVFVRLQVSGFCAEIFPIRNEYCQKALANSAQTDQFVFEDDPDDKSSKRLYAMFAKQHIIDYSLPFQTLCMTAENEIISPEGYHLEKGNLKERLALFKSRSMDRSFKQTSSIVDDDARFVVDSVDFESEDVLNYQIIAFAVAGIIFFIIVIIIMKNKKETEF